MEAVRIQQTQDGAAQVGSEVHTSDHLESAEGRHIRDDIVNIRKVPAFLAQGIKVFAHADGIRTDALERPDTAIRKEMGPDSEIIVQVLTAKDRLT